MSVLKASAKKTLNIIKNSAGTIRTRAIEGVAKNSWRLAYQQVAVTCVETRIREVAHYSSDAVFNQILSSLKSTIREEVKRIVNEKQMGNEFNRVLNRALAADAYYVRGRMVTEHRTNSIENFDKTKE